MKLQNTCMNLKRMKREPKVQRGISLSPELRDRIQRVADMLGRSWNEVAEAVLDEQIPPLPETTSKAENSRGSDTIEVA